MAEDEPTKIKIRVCLKKLSNSELSYYSLIINEMV